MARVIQVLLCTTLVLLVYGQQPVPRADPRVQEMEDRQRLTDLINLSKLLQTAARLAYPITTGINNVVSNIMDTDSYLLPNSQRHDSYERYPGPIQSRRGNIIRNRGRKRLRGDLQNQRRMSSRDATRRRAYKQSYYDYDYEYDDDYDSFESYESLETGDEFALHNSGVQSNLKSRGSNTKGVLLTETLENVPNDKFTLEPKKIGKPHNLVTSDGVSLRKSNLQIQSTGTNNPLINNDNPGNVLPASNNAKPKIIYVFLKPGDISPETNIPNENDVSESDEDYNGTINPRFAPLENNPVLVNGTSGLNVPI